MFHAIVEGILALILFSAIAFLCIGLAGPV